MGASDGGEKKQKPRFGGGGGSANGDVFDDERFSAMHRDPRFMAMPKKATTVTIDDRFKGLFEDPNFASGGGGTGLDKRGRRAASKTGAKLDAKARQRREMKEYYKMEDESDDDEDDGLEEKMEKSMDRMRGVGLVSSSDEDESESEDEDAEEDEDEGVLPTMLVGEADKDIPTIDATKRLAIVNCEWQHIRACDLFAVLRSFVPKGGSLEKVTVYPSDFGLERMAVENKYGPSNAFQKDDKKKKKAKAAEKKKKKDENDSDDGNEEGEEADNEQMRQYERDRLRYYYAIAEFDTVKTAMGVYHECDGIEYERSSFKLDLRYVPDDQSFDGRQVRDEAKDIPADYEAPEFQVKALQHSNVKLSWDDDDPVRRKTFRRKITEDNLKDEDFAAYLASDSDEESEDEEEEEEEDAKAAKKAYLAKLLGGSVGDDDDADEKDDFFLSDDEEDAEDTAKAATKAIKAKQDKKRFGSKSNAGDMEVTFHAGLEEFGARIKKRQKEGKLGVKETVYEKQERLRKEKREAKRLAAKAAKGAAEDAEEEFADGENAATFDDPFFMDDGGEIDFDAEYDSEDGAPKPKKKSSKFDDFDDAPSKTSLKKAKKKAKRGEVDEQAEADLELLMMDEKQILGKSDGARKPSKKSSEDEPKKKLSRKERLAEKRRLRGKAARRAESDEEDDGEPNKLDTTDERFAGLYESHHFSLDPTDPRYKEVQNKTLIINERDKRRKSKKESKTTKVVRSALHSDAKEVGSSELQSMLSSLKRKSKKM